MLVVRSEDPDQLAAAMDRLINDEALGRRSAAVLHNAVIVSFTWDRIVREYLTAMTEGR
jgi:glycosyltransferase involved in cell wall biosynthesis